METSSLDLEWIRDKLVLAEGVPHLRVGEFNEDAVLDRGFDHLPLPIVAARARDARSVFLDGHLQTKDDCGLILVEHGHAPPTVDDGKLPLSVYDTSPVVRLIVHIRAVAICLARFSALC
jgi:hypothetical protein